MRLPRLLLISLLLMLLAACGSKGPLVMPEEPPEAPAAQ
jgi:predicted small lipoprotein YifL